MKTVPANTIGIRMESVRLIECEFEANTRYRAKGPLVLPECVPNYKSYRRKDQLVCTLSVSLIHGKKKAPFQAKVTYQTKYRVDPKAEVDKKRFAQYTAPAHIYPYIREHISDLTRRNGMPPFTMQPVNIARFLKLSENKYSHGKGSSQKRQ